MKFRDIPKFTRCGSYEVNMSLKFLIKQIDQWIEEEGLQMIPDFQRGHVWTQEQQIKFIEYILRCGKSGRTLYFNNPSWHIPVTDGYNDFVCVDGLQRITAIRRFLNNEIPAFGILYLDYEGELDLVDHSMIVNVNDLKTRNEVLQWYIDMNDGGTPHTAAEIELVKKLMEES
jgi:uncharacterized protein with ParB-like and HNH nuclease domain